MATTYSTTDVSKRLGFTVSAAFVAQRGLTPVETIKGKPRWAANDFEKLCEGIRTYLSTRPADAQAEEDDEL